MKLWYLCIYYSWKIPELLIPKASLPILNFELSCCILWNWAWRWRSGTCRQVYSKGSFLAQSGSDHYYPWSDLWWICRPYNLLRMHLNCLLICWKISSSLWHMPLWCSLWFLSRTPLQCKILSVPAVSCFLFRFHQFSLCCGQLCLFNFLWQ